MFNSEYKNGSHIFTKTQFNYEHLFFKTYLQIFKMLFILADMAVIPDLAFAAVENWVLVMYEETWLLYDGNILTAHMWFGNLGTLLNNFYPLYIDIP